MTATQAMRYQRRQARAERERQQRIETAKGIAALLLVLLAFLVAGTIEYPDGQAEVARWESQGVTIHRW